MNEKVSSMVKEQQDVRVSEIFNTSSVEVQQDVRVCQLFNTSTLHFQKHEHLLTISPNLAVHSILFFHGGRD